MKTRSIYLIPKARVRVGSPAEEDIKCHKCLVIIAQSSKAKVFAENSAFSFEMSPPKKFTAKNAANGTRMD